MRLDSSEILSVIGETFHSFPLGFAADKEGAPCAAVLPPALARSDIYLLLCSNPKAPRRNSCRSRRSRRDWQGRAAPENPPEMLARKIQTPRRFRQHLSSASNKSRVDRRLRRGVSAQVAKPAARKRCA